MSVGDHLQVRVNDELVLHAGIFEERQCAHGIERLIRPPGTTLFHQVLAYLRAKPDPPRSLSGSIAGREGVAAAALTLRWGSYLAVLLDRGKPVWPEVHSAGTSRIADDEMARINIEASAALAEWVDLCRADWDGHHQQLVNRAISYLPMPKKTVQVESAHSPHLPGPIWRSELSSQRERSDLSASAPSPNAFPAASSRTPSSTPLGGTDLW